MLGNIGFLEISIIALILLVLFGAKRIPALFASIGQGIRELKNSLLGEEVTKTAERSTSRVPGATELGDGR